MKNYISKLLQIQPEESFMKAETMESIKSIVIEEVKSLENLDTIWNKLSIIRNEVVGFISQKQLKLTIDNKYLPEENAKEFYNLGTLLSMITHTIDVMIRSITAMEVK